MTGEILLLILEIIGTVAFAISGAFVAIHKNLDIFGVIFIGCITAVGGGIMRDILIGVTPPLIFSNLYILLVAAVTAVLAFIVAYVARKRFEKIQEKVERINNVFDAIGLAAFSVMGTEIAFINGVSDNAVLSILLGMLTGVGGGLLRDILTSTTPYIFKKHVYALAAIGGAALYYILRLTAYGAVIPSAFGMFIVFSVRMLATKYRWSLPKVPLQEDPKPFRLFKRQKMEEMQVKNTEEATKQAIEQVIEQTAQPKADEETLAS